MKKCAVAASWVLLVIGLFTRTSIAEEIPIQVSPSTINLAYKGEVVTVHADIPYRGVVTASLTLNGVEIWYTKADNQGDLVAKFAVEDVKEIVAPPSAELTLSGMVETAEGILVPFSGTDSVRVIDKGAKN